MKERNESVTLAIRCTQSEKDEIVRFSTAQGYSTVSDWLREVIDSAIHPEKGEPNAVKPLSLVKQISMDEEAADLIYQLVADKLRLADLRAELAAFSRAPRAESFEELDAELRLTAARVASLPQSPVDGEYIANGEIFVTLNWEKKRWRLSDYLSWSDERRRGYTFYLMTIEESSGETAYYFWHRHNDFSKEFLEKFVAHGFDTESETAFVYGANFAVAEWCRRQERSYLEKRIVQMMRYAARDNNIGEYKELFDEKLRFFTVRNANGIPPGIPYEFTFGWVSDARNAGDTYYMSAKEAAEAGRDKIDVSFRPVAECRWHYTAEECRERKIEVPLPFDKEAVPKQMQRFLVQ